MLEFEQCKTADELLLNGWIDIEAHRRIMRNIEVNERGSMDKRNEPDSITVDITIKGEGTQREVRRTYIHELLIPDYIKFNDKPYKVIRVLIVSRGKLLCPADRRSSIGKLRRCK